VASSEFYDEKTKKYDLDFKSEGESAAEYLLSYQELSALYKELIAKYDIVSVEDPFAEDDWEAWQHFYEGADFQIVG